MYSCVHVQGDTQLCLLTPEVIPTQKHYIHIGQILEGSFLILYVLRMMQNAIFKPLLHALKCEHNRHTISYMLWHFLSIIIRESLYRLKLCPSNWSIVWGTATHWHSHCVSEWLWLTLQTNLNHITLTDIRTSWWWHSGCTETCRRLCIYCVHISLHVRVV